MMTRNAPSTWAQGKPWFPWGYSFDPSPGDPHRIQFRVHVKDGLPFEIERHVQLRNADGTPGEAKSIRFPWPG